MSIYNEYKNIEQRYAEPVPTVDFKQGDVIVISDLHIPFHAKDEIDIVINTLSDKDKLLVINGDMLDNNHVSSFPTDKKHRLLDEIRIANEYLYNWSKKFKHIFVLDGNHERRINRFVKNNAPELSPFIHGTMAWWATRNIKIVDDKIYEIGAIANVTYIPYRFFKINNVLFAHPLDYLKTPGGTVRKVIETAIGERIEFDICIIGHTHKVALVNHLGRRGIETGCMTLHRDYVIEAGRMAPTNQLGYTVLTMNDYKCVSFSPVDISYYNNL